jgi:hypothetical protein
VYIFASHTHIPVKQLGGEGKRWSLEPAFPAAHRFSTSLERSFWLPTENGTFPLGKQQEKGFPFAPSPASGRDETNRCPQGCRRSPDRKLYLRDMTPSPLTGVICGWRVSEQDRLPLRHDLEQVNPKIEVITAALDGDKITLNSALYSLVESARDLDSIMVFIGFQVHCSFLIGFMPGDRIAWIRGNEFVGRTISQH